MALKIDATKGNLQLTDGYLFARSAEFRKSTLRVHQLVVVEEAQEPSEEHPAGIPEKTEIQVSMVNRSEWSVVFQLLLNQDQRADLSSATVLATKSVVIEGDSEMNSIANAYSHLGTDFDGWTITASEEV